MLVETVMDVVKEYGTVLVEDPDRVGKVKHFGVDETSYLKATSDHPTLYAASLVDLEAKKLIDLVRATLPLACGDGSLGGTTGGWPV